MGLVAPPAARVSGHVALVQRKRGAQWYARWRWPDGRSAQRRLGPAWTERGRPPEGWHTRRSANAALDAILTDIRRGTGLPARRSGVTFGAACEEWLRYVREDKRVRRSTITDYERVVRTHLLPSFGSDTRLDKITAAQVERWRNHLVHERGLSPRSIDKLLTNLNGVFSRAQRVHGLRENPIARVERRPTRRSGDFRVLEPDEVHAVARAAATAFDAALITVAAFTGLRLGELRGLRWRDVDFAKQLVHVRQSYVAGEYGLPKSGRVRSVPLIDQAAAALDQLSRRPYFTGPDDLVFGTALGKPFDDSRLRRRFAKAVAGAGLPPLRFHDLRHTFGTLGVQVWPLSTVQAFLGHADVQTTMIYVHHTPQHDAAARLTALVASTNGGADKHPTAIRP